MKRLVAILYIACVVGAGCGSKNNPGGPSGNPNVVVFTAQLSGANENPPISGAEAGGGGSVTITFNLTKDAGGTITGATVTFAMTATALPANTPITAGHIHEGRTGINGPVRISTGLTPGAPFLLATGSGNLTINNVNVDAAFAPRVQDIINDPSGWYFNLHSLLNGGGVIRGQLVKQ